VTVASEVSSISYAGNGVTLAFTIPFRFLSTSDIQVRRRNADGSIELLTTGFSITGGDPTGLCTFVVAPESGTDVIIDRAPLLLQPAAYPSNDKFPSATHETALDRQTFIGQYLRRLINHSIRVPFGDASTGFLLPSPEFRANTYLYFDANGAPSLTANPPTVPPVIPTPAIVRLAAKVYCIGDSITEGGSGGALGSYPNALQQLLTARGDGPYIVSNNGRSGEPVVWIAERVDEEIFSVPDGSYVVTLAGVNDLRWGETTFSVAEIKAALQSIYTKAKTAGAKVIACTILPFKGYLGGGDPTKAWDSDKQADLEEINDWILNTAINVDFRVDTYSAFNDPSDDGALLSQYDIGDHLHLNGAEAVSPAEDGYSYLAQVIYDAVTWSGSVVAPQIAISGPYGRVNQDVSTTASPQFIALRVGGTDAVTGYVSAPKAIYYPTFQINTGASHTVGLGTNTAFRLLSVSNRGEEGLEVGPGNWNPADAIGKVTSLCYNRATSAYVTNNQLAGSYDWNIATSLKMRLTSNGFLGIGGNTSPVSELVISDTAGARGIEFNPAAGTGLTRMMAFDRVAVDTVNLEIIATGIKLYPGISNAAAWMCDAAGLYPVTDNSVPLGKSGNRPSVIWAASGSISTSDGEKKRKRGLFGLTEAEILVGRELAGMIGLYQWLDAIEQKGDAARYHVGPIYQEAWDVFVKHGLDPSRYAIFCEDPVIEKVTRTRVVRKRKLETSTRIDTYVEVVDGRAVIRQREISEQVPVTVKLPIFTETGEQVFDAATDHEGNVVSRTPRFYEQEVFEEVEEPYFEEAVTDRTEKGMRHTLLLYFIVAALAHP
jgi:lysophospholipase L1-like esterase